MAVSTLAARLRTAAWLGWQVESNWADLYLFVVYAVARPLATALILVGMYWAVRGHAVRAEAFTALWIGNAFHIYVTTVLLGMGYVVVEEREDYETLKYVYTSPIGMFTYLSGRSTVKLVLASISVALTLLVGWFVLGVRWDLTHVAWLPFLAALVLGLTATLFLGFFVAGMALLLPRIAINMNEGIGVVLYLLSGVIFPIDLLPRAVQWVSLALPFTYWYEALRRSLLGHGGSAILALWSDAAVWGALLGTTLVFVALSRWGYDVLERRARQLGRLDQTTMF